MSYTIQITRKELNLLLHGLGAGIGDDGIENIGLTRKEQAALGKIANRLHKLRNEAGPYYENVADYK